jgi:hypothetical protein
VGRKAGFLCACAVGAAFALGASEVGVAAYHAVVPANSVGTVQLKNGAVTGAKVKVHSLTALNFRAGQLPAGPPGPPGPAGPAGPGGPAGAPASLGLQLVGGESGFDNSGSKSATASCPAGKRAISWAARIQLVTTANPQAAPGVTDVIPNNGDISSGTLPDGYTAQAQTFGFYPDPWKLFVYATCATA